MAYTFTLSDGTTTVDLNDLTNFQVRQNGFAAPTPQRRQSWSGAGNLVQSGRRFIMEAFDNRLVTLRLSVMATSKDNLIALLFDVEEILRKAKEHSNHKLGSQVQLTVQWTGATNAVKFNVLTGVFDPMGAAMHNVILTNAHRLENVPLVLECEPLAVMAQETVENHLRDAGFDISAITDWTESNTASGATSRETTIKVKGAASLKLSMTDSTSGGERISRHQARTAAAADVWSGYAWVRIDALSSAHLELHIQFLDTNSIMIAEQLYNYSTVDASNWYRIPLTSLTAPTGTTQIRFWPQLVSEAVDATGTVYVDLTLADKVTAFASFWVSGREVLNNLEGDVQAETNYIDIYDVEGDVPAGMQIKATENEAHTAFWCGARHVGRMTDTGLWHEGEGFTGLDTAVDANASAGNVGERQILAVHDASSDSENTASATLTHSHTITTKKDSILIVFVVLRDATEDTPTGVTYGGQAMTQWGSTVSDTATDAISMWYLVSPTNTGAQDVVATFATACDEIGIMAHSYYGVDQTTPLGTANTATSLDATPTVDITAVVRDLVICGVVSDGTQTYTPGSDQTERAELDGATNMGGTVSEERATSTTVTMSHTMGNNNWATIGAALKPLGQSVSAFYTVTKAISTPPVGQYLVLARVQGNGTSTDLKVGTGYTYGGVTCDPSLAAEFVQANDGAYGIVDLGTIQLPPADTPDNITAGSVTLRLHFYDEGSATDTKPQVDWVMLLPVDFGAAIIKAKTSAADIVLLDSISDRHVIALINSSDVLQSMPASAVGSPPEAHPEGTRVYFHSDDGAADIDDGFTVAVTLEQRFLSLRKA